MLTLLIKMRMQIVRNKYAINSMMAGQPQNVMHIGLQGTNLNEMEDFPRWSVVRLQASGLFLQVENMFRAHI